ncbi:cytochrome P450 71A1-like [Morus notabilis]|uniref:cytochrome P450 71A1-like n=1 Tax=Morus notabilis TaxID=981085 RepID=UPI000CED5063|nr:cytochrome P450 71A1-like [Morus notabilis]
MESHVLHLLKHLWQELELTPFLVFLFLLSLLFLFILCRYSRSKLNLPPSPTRLPLIGNLHQLGTHPHRSFRALSEKYGPLMLLHLGQVPTLVVSSADMVKEIIKNHDVTFANRAKSTASEIIVYGCQDVGFAPYGEHWRQARKICVLHLLSHRRVQQFQAVREEVTAEMIDRIGRASRSRKDSSINLSELLIAASNNILSRCVLGRNFADQDGPSRFGELSRKIVENMVAFSVGDFFPSLTWLDNLTGLIGRLNLMFKEVDTFFDEVIEEHRAVLLEGGDDIGGSNIKDFVDILLGVQKLGMLDFDLTLNKMKAILVDMFIGGSDTTSATLEWVMAELLRHPKVMEKAQEEVRRVVGINRSKIDMNVVNQMDYLKCVIKETLRLHPPVPFLVPRETTASVEMGGFHIPEKTRVFINTWAIQRDPNVWDKPEEFVPERFHDSDVDFNGQDFQFVPFGSGRRICPGLTFGVFSTEYVIANLLYWFDWKLPVDDGIILPNDLDMSEVYGLVIHKKFPLNIVPIPYSP